MTKEVYMNSYRDYRHAITRLLTPCTPAQRLTFVQALIAAVAAAVPPDHYRLEPETDWPHWQRLLQQVRQSQWNRAMIAEALAALDASAEAQQQLRHTDMANLSFVVLLDAWLLLTECCDDDEASLQVALSAADQYLDLADSEVEAIEGSAPDLAIWLQHPHIAAAWQRVQSFVPRA